jgi:hypothetical protein
LSWDTLSILLTSSLLKASIQQVPSINLTACRTMCSEAMARSGVTFERDYLCMRWYARGYLQMSDYCEQYKLFFYLLIAVVICLYYKMININITYKDISSGKEVEHWS